MAITNGYGVEIVRREEIQWEKWLKRMPNLAEEWQIKNAKQHIKQRTQTKYKIYAEEKRHTETIYRITTINRVGGYDPEGNEGHGD